MYMLEPADIRALREFLKMTPTQFAGLLGVSENTVRRWEIGDRHPKRDHVKALNKLLLDAQAKDFKLPRRKLSTAAG